MRGGGVLLVLRVPSAPLGLEAGGEAAVEVGVGEGGGEAICVLGVGPGVTPEREPEFAAPTGKVSNALGGLEGARDVLGGVRSTAVDALVLLYIRVGLGGDCSRVNAVDSAERAVQPEPPVRGVLVEGGEVGSDFDLGGEAGAADLREVGESGDDPARGASSSGVGLAGRRGRDVEGYGGARGRWR